MSNHPLKEHTILNPAVTNDEFIDFSKIFDSLKRNWMILFACIFAAIICAAILANVLPSRWQASVTMQIGQMPSPINAIAPIEEPIQTIERVKLRELQSSALTALKLPLDERVDKHTNLFKSSIKASAIKNTNFIQIKLAGFTPEEAQKNLAVTAQALISSHQALVLPVRNRLIKKQQDNAKKIADAEAERAKLFQLLANTGNLKSAPQFAPNIVAISLLENKEAELRSLVVEKTRLQDLLESIAIYPTRIIDAVYVDNRPYFPKLSLFLAAGAFLGLLLGLGIALWRDRKYF
ncbi:MAG: Wzz/FepE/Etk N-terminal domain-containing protein [Burkholderiaceae bacterium]